MKLGLSYRTCQFIDFRERLESRGISRRSSFADHSKETLNDSLNLSNLRMDFNERYISSSENFNNRLILSLADFIGLCWPELFHLINGLCLDDSRFWIEDFFGIDDFSLDVGICGITDYSLK